MSQRTTRFGSLERWEKGGVEVIDDDPRHYVFSNLFEVASKAKPYEKVAVGKNLEYVIEAIRAEGPSPWRAPAHDESALVMDGEVEIHLLKLADPGVVPAGTTARSSSRADAHRQEDGMSSGAARPHDAAAQGRGLSVPREPPSVILLQTLKGDRTPSSAGTTSARRPPRRKEPDGGPRCTTEDSAPTDQGYRTFPSASSVSSATSTSPTSLCRRPAPRCRWTPSCAR